MRPNELKPWQIEAAVEFVREPLATLFNARHTKAGTLRNEDNVTLTVQQLGHLMAWYAETRIEAIQAPPQQIGAASAMKQRALTAGDE